MFKTLTNAWKTPELRKKLIVTVFIIILYRLGSTIPMPYVNAGLMESINTIYGGTILQYLNILSGSAFAQATLFALSISPYITASIVIQLLTVAIPALEKLSKNGEEGRKKLTQITRYVTVVLGLITAFGYYMFLRNQGWLTNNSVFVAFVIIACYGAGAALIMWLAEKINEHGIGNGISMILFANILASGTQIISTFSEFIKEGPWGIVKTEVIVVISLAIITFVVFVTESERRIPVQYAKKVVGRKQYGGQSSNLPIKLNMSGVMPIIFANSIVAIPATIGMIAGVDTNGTGFWSKFINFFSAGSWFYVIIFVILIIAFAYFYVSISFNPVEVANNMKKQGGFIPGIRPGKPTSDYIKKILGRITLIGAFFLCIVAALPLIASIISGGVLSGIAFGGSSLLIVVGVALETARELEAQLTMRHYKGFLE
ncbi:MAG: preprotein translocase subunit SecY [Clostridia bacterium]|nr:preprotein translocase subunit SecY [Clostridia bacterium]